jgi:hypothetical protein
MSLRIRRGSDAERLAVRFDQGEIVWVNSTTTSRPAYKLYVGDGVTYGGRDIVETSAGNKLTYNTNTGRLDVTGLTTDDIAPGTNNKFFTPELAQDAVGAMFAAGTMSGITFVYDDVGNRMNVTVTAQGGGGGGSGITSLLQDPTPTLGGTFQLNSHNITGTGNIDITGNITATGTIIATTGLGADLVLNGFNLSGVGNLNTTGDIHATGTFIAGGGLGANLALNNHNITGDGSININGSIASATGLGADLVLNSHNITGTGNININGNIVATGYIDPGIGLHKNLDINSHDIVGTGNINITGALTISSLFTGGRVALTNLSNNPGILIDSNNGGNTNDYDWLSINTFHNDEDAAAIQLSRARGTFALPASLNDGDYIFKIIAGGITTDNSKAVATAIVSSVKGTVSAGKLPGQLDLYTSTTAGTLISAISIDSAQKVTFSGRILASDGTAGAPSVAFTTDGGIDSGFFHPGDGIVCLSINGVEKSRFDSGGLRVGGFVKVAQVSGTLPAPAEAGMIVLDGTTFKGYNGSSWVNLN